MGVILKISYVLFVCFFLCCQNKNIPYPITQKSDHRDTYFGTTVSDPYQWLEDDRSKETAAWVKAQNRITFAYLNRIPYRKKIQDRLTSLWNYPRMSAPWKEGGYYFYAKNSGLQNQSVYYKLDSLSAKPQVILDPNTISKDGTTSLATFSVSPDGRYLGYGISQAGSDWREFFVKEIKTGTLLSDHLKWIKFSGIAWHKGGFFYSAYPKPDSQSTLSGQNENNRVYYHRLGTQQQEDKLIYENSSYPRRGFFPSVTEDGKVLVISAIETTSGNALYIKDLTRPNRPIKKIITTFDDDFQVVDHHNGDLLVLTNHKAPNYRLIAIDLQNSQPLAWSEVIPEHPHEVLSQVVIGGDRIIALFQKDAHSVMKVFDQEGAYLHTVPLPGIGTVYQCNAKRKEDRAFYTFTSFTKPTNVYTYHIEENRSEPFFKAAVDCNTDDFVTKQLFFTSKDSTTVPLFVVHKKDLALSGDNPLLLYGYGGFNISITPAFRPSRLVWLENGGVYASVNLRGGGEYGEKWHLAGTKMNKQNVFDDFIAAARFLISKGYTNPEKLAIQGRSNGGLLIGAVVNQEPELFRVALPAVGVMDMLKYHTFTIGHYWAVDYGTSADSKEMFEYLYGYSPVHTIKEGQNYPAILVTTADHDDRVVPAHSFKYMATLQEKYKGPNPTLIRIETQSGHGGGKPVAKQIEEEADIWAFTFYNLGMKPR